MTSETVDLRQISQDLKAIREDLDYIKGHMIDMDTILSSEDKKLLDESFENEKSGNLTSLKELENVRNII